MRTDSAKNQFAQIYKSHSDAVFRFCLMKTSNRDQALDLTQDTFMRFWDTLSNGEKKIKNSRAFLFTIARNLIIDWYRKKKAVSLDALEEGQDDMEGPTLAFVESTAEIESEAKVLVAKIAELEEPYQHVVYLRFVEEMKPKEIAEIVGESVNVVSVRINRGLAKLRQILHHEITQ